MGGKNENDSAKLDSLPPGFNGRAMLLSHQAKKFMLPPSYSLKKGLRCVVVVILR